MSDAREVETAICRRCGRGFIVTQNHLGLLRRRGVLVAKPLHCPTCFLKVGSIPKDSGKVTWFDPRRRYGFIAADGGDQVFFHEEQVLSTGRPTLDSGQAVSFHVLDTPKGLAAHNVEVLDG